MQIVLGIAPGGPGRAAAGLHPAVRKNNLGLHHGGVFRQFGKILQQAVHHRHGLEGIVIDNKAVFAVYLPERQVVILCKAPHFPALDDMDGRIAGSKGFPVLRLHEIGHHPYIQRRPVLREQAVQAGIQVHGGVPHANNDHTYLSHSRLHLRQARRRL